MEFLLIGDSKLKVIMSGEDMRTFKLDKASDYSSPSYRRAFWKVLDLAKGEVGFDTEGDKVLIQFYPLKSGGCEVFVTKLGVLPKESARIVTQSDRVTMLSRAKSFYAFDTMEDMKNFADAIKQRLTEPYPISDIYITGASVCYLSIEEYAKGGDTVEFPQILEFARTVTADLEFYITEHLTRITDGDALERLPTL